MKSYLAIIDKSVMTFTKKKGKNIVPEKKTLVITEL